MTTSTSSGHCHGCGNYTSQRSAEVRGKVVFVCLKCHFENSALHAVTEDGRQLRCVDCKRIAT